MKVAGSGIRRLREAGIDVVVGVGEAEARRLNAPYLTLRAKERPYVHAKWAMTLDGKFATRTGQSKWISGEESRLRAHQLRGRMDGIIVGAGTVRADDPLLTARPPGPRTAVRVVLSNDGRLPEGCQLLQTAREAPVLVAGANITGPERAALESAGCEVVEINSVGELLADFGRRRFTNMLVEGGAGILGAFRDAGILGEVHAFVAPTLAGGVEARTPMGGIGADAIAEGLRLQELNVERLGNDVYINGRVA